jgi:hypothetical protein
MAKMATSTAATLAVPQAALQRGGDGRALGFECASWSHLQSYIGLLDRVPSDSGADVAGVGPALDKLRQLVRRFGSPSLVRELMGDQPRALCVDTAPEMPYAALVWWSSGLQAAAAQVAAILQALPKPAGDGEPQQELLRTLGGVADRAWRRIAPLSDALAGFKYPLLEANLELSEACRRAGDTLQRIEQEVGGLHERIGRQERQIAQLGLFGAHRKQDLLSQLHALQKERAQAMGRASRFQIQLGALDGLLDEGVWLESALDGAVDSLEKLKEAWAEFGWGVTQLAADASPAQLAEASWIEHALARTEAVRQWTALERAARRFSDELLLAGVTSRHGNV